jgi:formylglycine-generating enzyme required for sulfatase activity
VQFVAELGILSFYVSVRSGCATSNDARIRLLVTEPFLFGAEFMSKRDRDSMEASTGKCRRGFFTYRPATRRAFGKICSAVLVSLLLTGCGGSTPAPAPQAVETDRPAANSGPVGFAKRAEEEVDDSIDLSGVDPNDIFDFAAAPLPNFLTTGKAPPSRPEDRFVATIDPGAGSTNFQTDAPSVRNTNAGNGANVGSLPAGFTAVVGAPIVDGWPSRIVCKADKSEMVFVPAGNSIVGTGDGPDDCVPEVPVSLSAFYISKLEVNVAQYSEFRSKSIKVGKVVEKSLNVDAPSDFPAVGVAWVEARAYAQASRRELPTECQWEKAARGSQGLAAPWGNGRPLWSEPRKAGQVDPCGMFPDDESVYGVLDMAGNAREWLFDFYSETNHEDLATMDAARRTNWAGPRRASQTGERVVKGDGPAWAAWFRRGVRMTERSPNIGFRCVLNLPASQ